MAAMPLYLKSHSYGEYVFDHAWADAYAHHHLAYYPKLVCAIPFSPVTSARLLTQQTSMAPMLLDAVSQILTSHDLSSAHVLFPDEVSSQYLEQAQWLKRTGVQFRWENKAYGNWDDFLATLNHDKRKKIKQERKKIVQSNIKCRYVLGSDITERDWDFFYRCYCNTYQAHYSTPYLTRQFFSEIGASMPHHLLLIVASQHGRDIATTLNFYNERTLYGRYWGALEHVPNLHFELCYYQAQAFCIDKKIQFFEGGAQGEHKLARGFDPRPTVSYHQIAHPDFKVAIQDFLRRESPHVAHYQHELEERTPFKSG
jgi:predicted N-acyltransferase